MFSDLHRQRSKLTREKDDLRGLAKRLNKLTPGTTKYAKALEELDNCKARIETMKVRVKEMANEQDIAKVNRRLSCIIDTLSVCINTGDTLNEGGLRAIRADIVATVAYLEGKKND